MNQGQGSSRSQPSGMGPQADHIGPHDPAPSAAGEPMSWFETEKRRRNVADGFLETKGLKDGHCNRRACQKPLSDERVRCSMSDHELNTDGRLFYCMACADLFDDADRRSPHGPRIRRERRLA